MSPKFQKYFVIALLFLHCLVTLHGANILFLVPFPGPSQWIFISKFVTELLARGHSVTAITNFPLKTSNGNYTQIHISPTFDFGPFGKKNYLPTYYKYLILYIDLSNYFFLKTIDLHIRC